jgi:hypothetical protein
MSISFFFLSLLFVLFETIRIFCYETSFQYKNFYSFEFKSWGWFSSSFLCLISPQHTCFSFLYKQFLIQILRVFSFYVKIFFSQFKAPLELKPKTSDPSTHTKLSGRQKSPSGYTFQIVSIRFRLNSLQIQPPLCYKRHLKKIL